MNLAVDSGKAVVYTGAVVGVGYLTFLGLGAIAEGLGYVGDIVEEVRDKTKEVIFGKETYPTSQPMPADGGVGRDPDTGERINPVSNVPIMGGLVGLGISLGESSFGFFTDLDNAIRDLVGADPNENA